MVEAMNLRAFALVIGGVASVSIGLLACQSTTSSGGTGGAGGSTTDGGDGSDGGCVVDLSSCAEALLVGGVPCPSVPMVWAYYQAYVKCADVSCPVECANLASRGASCACQNCMAATCASQVDNCANN